MLESYSEKGEDYFKMNVIRVKPLNNVNYVTNINIDTLSCRMEVGYNDRTKKRYISLKTLNGTVLLYRTFIDVGRRVELNNNATLLGLNYYVILEPTQTGVDNRDFFNWKDNYTITFVGNRTEVNDYIDQKYRESVVGN
jgi:hypothetical protein